MLLRIGSSSIGSGTWSETAVEPIHSHGDRKMRLGPALAGYTRRKSAGLYCAYVDSDGGLKCEVKFDGQSISGRGLGRWTPVNFDKPRKSTSAPALAVFEGQLKCAYRDADKSRYVILTYNRRRALSGIAIPRPGTWIEDNSFPDLETSTIALAGWRPSQDSGSWPLAV